ncbi:MAG: hypothetical protein EON93_12610 [Burkholderiales bacterium]|nr:MAG: hypothetical protein EON93_12610 [Burkholderiales bacterium]
MRLVLLTPLTLAVVLSACGPSSAPESEPAERASVEPAPLDPEAPAAEQAALASCGTVTAQGYCGVTFGMTPQQANAKFPGGLENYDGADPSGQADPNHCFEMFGIEPVQGISFLIEGQKVGRVDVLTEAARTADGFGVGTEAQAIRDRFAAAAMDAPNKYEPEVTDLAVTDGAAKYVFEIQDGKVRGWRAGVAPTIDYTEHCG